MATYRADTGLHLIEFEAYSDFAAWEMFPNAKKISRADGKAMDEKECAEALKLIEENKAQFDN